VQAACPLSSYKLALANPVEPHPQLILRRGSSCNSWNKAALWACHMFSFDSSTFALRNSRSEPLKSKGIFCRDCTIGRITVTAMLICVGVGFDSRKGVCHRKIMTCIFPCDMTEILYGRFVIREFESRLAGLSVLDRSTPHAHSRT
jgi:hypothetical protein